MVKIIFIGDPHFQVDNIPEVNLFISKLEEYIKSQKPDIIIVAGDLLHTHERLHSIPLNKAFEFILILRSYAITFVLVGNHDMLNNQQFLTSNHWMNAMKEWDNVIIVDKVFNYHVNNFHFIFVPYVPPSRFEEALNTNEENWKDCDCIFAHQEFEGCKMGMINSIVGDKWPLNYPNVVSGHIHKNHTPQPNIYYSGSAMQHAFGESENNIIALLTFVEKKKYILYEHDLELPRKKIIYTDIASIENIIPEKTEDEIKYTISGSYEEFKTFKQTQKYKEFIKNGTKIVFKTTKVEKKDKDENMAIASMKSDFYDILNELILFENNENLEKTFEKILNRKIVSNNVIFE